MDISYEEYLANGYKEVWGIGNEDTLRKYCKGERLLLTKMVDLDTALYGKEKPEGYVIDYEFENEYEKKYIGYKIGCRGFVKFLDGDDAEIEYFIKREKEYWETARQKGRENKQKSGEFIGGSIPYGYYLVKKKLYVDDYESFVVKFVFYRYSQGCAFGGIARELNLRGFRNRNNNPFKAGSIKSIIENRRLYQGYFTYKGKEIKGKFRGILEDSEELLTKEWINRVFDAETEAKIAEHAKRIHGDKSIPHEIRPYIVADDSFDGRMKVRRVKREIRRSVQ